ncbi:hypothetical protein H4I96_10753 [Botrytis cinerea]
MESFHGDWLNIAASATSEQTPFNQNNGPIQSYNFNQLHNNGNENSHALSLDQISSDLPQANLSSFQHLNGTTFHPDDTSFNPHSHLSASSTFNSRPLMPPQSQILRQFLVNRSKDHENTPHFFGVEDKQHQNQYDNQSYSDLKSELLQIISKLKEEFDTEKRMRMAIQRQLENIKYESDTYITSILSFSEKCGEFLTTFPRQMKEAKAAFDDKVSILDRKIAEVELLKQQLQTGII